MKIIAVVGSGSGCGKTTVACRILQAIPGLGAVKISPRDEPARVEWGRGLPGKDTDRYAASGAARVARFVGPREQVPGAWAGIAGEFESLPAVVVEGARSIDVPGERFVIFVSSPEADLTRRERSAGLRAVSDALVSMEARFGPCDRAGTAPSSSLEIASVRDLRAGQDTPAGDGSLLIRMIERFLGGRRTCRQA